MKYFEINQSKKIKWEYLKIKLFKLNLKKKTTNNSLMKEYKLG